jgi:hypothetical protein
VIPTAAETDSGTPATCFSCAPTIMKNVGSKSPSVSPDIFGSSAQVIKSSRLPGTKMIPSERTMLPSIMRCVAGFVTSLFENPSTHRPASGRLPHKRAYRAFSASAPRPLIDVYPSSNLAARFCSAAFTALGKYPYSFGRSNPTLAVTLGAARDASTGTEAVFTGLSNLDLAGGAACDASIGTETVFTAGTKAVFTGLSNLDLAGGGACDASTGTETEVVFTGFSNLACVITDRREEARPGLPVGRRPGDGRRDEDRPTTEADIAEVESRGSERTCLCGVGVMRAPDGWRGQLSLSGDF